ncbi:MAG: MFS transporter [Rhodospirillaceae bacterium]
MTAVFSAPRSVVAVLFAALAANAAGHAFVLIVLPPLARRLGFSDLQAGMLLSLSALVMTLAAPVWGGVCDRRGRRRVILAGLGAGAVFLAACAAVVAARLAGGLSAAAAFGLLFAARILQAALGAGLMPAAQAVFADITRDDRRAGGMGTMGAAFGIGSILGGAAAWRLASGMPEAGFLLLSACLAAAVGGIALTLPETRAAPPPEALAAGTLPFAAIARFLAVTLLGLAVYSLLQQVTVLRLQDGFGLPPDRAMRAGGGAMMLAMTAMAAMQLGVVRRLRWPPGRLSRTGAAAALACLAAAAAAPGVAALVAATAGLGASLGLLLPGNLAALSLRAGPAAQARAAGINAVAQGMGMALGPIGGAALHQIAPTAPYAAAAAAMTVVCALTWVFRREGGFGV